ncbi:ferredoxin--NADP reductase [Lactobacillus crispatus]|uniref:ferredoxin--NADP reductase n=1 Tax=Lactobacillus crispatus TaxID=47770 RepID=UPI001F090231|nr:FAD-binding oxidoreductase [Lactobacillus crispatus]
MNKFEEIKGIIDLKKLQNERKHEIPNASDAELPKKYPMNILEEELHPETQYLKITKIIDRDDAKSFVFVPDESKGTSKLAYFQAGQYISLKLHIGKSYCTRAYAISSTPKQALSGEYMLTIKLVKNGYVTPYIWENWKVGTEVAASGPAGQLFYEPLRDKKTIIAGGSGITPFYSMAGAIADGTIDANLIILYGSRTHNHILLGDELDRIAAKTDKVKVVNILSDEEVVMW